MSKLQIVDESSDDELFIRLRSDNATIYPSQRLDSEDPDEILFLEVVSRMQSGEMVRESLNLALEAAYVLGYEAGKKAAAESF